MSAPTTLEAEFAPVIIGRFEKTYSRNRRMSERARQNIVYGPLADLEAEFSAALLRPALEETLVRFTFGPSTLRWFAYTRAAARIFQQRGHGRV